MVFQDKETRNYEAMLRYAGEKAMAGRPILDCALRCRVTAVFAVPQSKPQKWRADALAGYVRHTVKPDDDNLLKVRDSLKGIVFRDDCLFVESVVRKFYGENPCWMIEIWRFSALLV
jgi:Holliday junction resolvase RusA-like endonuclease